MLVFSVHMTKKRNLHLQNFTVLGDGYKINVVKSYSKHKDLEKDSPLQITRKILIADPHFPEL